MIISSQGSEDAGFQGRAFEYITQSTSRWTSHAVNLQNGNLLFQIEPMSLTGTLFPLVFQLTYNSTNADLDIGMGKGWISNLHASITEEPNGDLLWVDSSGAKHRFIYQPVPQTYLNPSGFAGSMEKLPNGSFKLTSLSGVAQLYSSDGKLTTISPPSGDASTEVNYDGNGRPIAFSDTLSGRTITLNWNVQGYLTEIEDEMNRSWSLDYDQDHYLISVTQPGNNNPASAGFVYDEDLGLVEHTDFMGYAYTYRYYAQGAQEGRLEEWEDSMGNIWAFAYDLQVQHYASKTTVTNGAGIETFYYFGTGSKALEKVSMGSTPDDITQTFSYTAQGWLSTATNALGLTTEYTYNSVGHVTEIIWPPSEPMATPYVQQWVYQPPDSLEGKLTLQRERINAFLWNETSFEYQDQNAPTLPSSITNALNETTTISYNAHALPTQITYPIGTGQSVATITTTYHPTSYLPQERLDPMGNATALSYNNNGQVVQMIQYEGSVMQGNVKNMLEISYDDIGRAILRENLVTGDESGISYNPNGFGGLTFNIDCEDEEETEFELGDPGNWVIRPSPPTQYQPSDPPPPDFTPFPGIPGGNYIIPGQSLPRPTPTPGYRPNVHTRTNSRDFTTQFDYNGAGQKIEQTDHLGRSTLIEYDTFGRPETITSPDDTETSLTYNAGSQLVELSTSRHGTTYYDYDDMGRLISVADPIKGVLSATYNLRGNVLTNSQGTHSYDMLGRRTQTQYTGGGGTDTWSYTRDGRIASHNQEIYTYDALGNLTSWDSQGPDGSVSFSYAGHTSLGLPVASTGNGPIGNYSYGYNTQYLLDTLTNTSKNPQQTFLYGYESDKRLASLNYPNQTQNSFMYDSKQLAQIQVQYLGTNPPVNFLLTDGAFNLEGQRTDYSFSVFDGQGGMFSEAYSYDYDLTGRTASIEYQNLNRTLEYAYDAQSGHLTSMECSDRGLYQYQHDGEGRLQTVTYPNLSQETYTYQGGLGRLSQIQYPNLETLDFTWNIKNQLTQLATTNPNGTTYVTFTHNQRGKVASYAQIEGGITTKEWSFFYGPHGLEKANLVEYGIPTLTQDYTTDPKGRILSMTHTPQGGGQGFSGELFFHYDNYGYLSLLTSDTGGPQASFQYDPVTKMLLNSWNPQNIEIPIVTSQGNIQLQFADRVVITNGVTLIPGFDNSVRIEREGYASSMEGDSGSSGESDQDYNDCICACDPARKADFGGLSEEEFRSNNTWYDFTKAYYDRLKELSCEGIKKDGSSEAGDEDRNPKTGELSFTAYWFQRYWDDEDKNLPSYYCINPWNDRDYLEFLELYYPRGLSEGYCPLTRAAAASLQTRDCMIVCCRLHVW